MSFIINNIKDYFKKDEDNFVMPVKNNEIYQKALVSKFDKVNSSKSFKEFQKGIISNLLSELSFTKGIDVFYESLYDVLGYYNEFTGDVAFSNKLFKTKNNLGYSLLTTSHEIRHKYQMEKCNKELKHFSGKEQTRFPHIYKYISSLCGLNKNIFYNTSKSEIDAEVFSANFSVDYLQQFKEISKSLYGNKYEDFFEKQIKTMLLYRDCKNVFYQGYSYSFLKNLPVICVNCSNAFNDYYSLTYALMKGEKLSYFQQASLNYLNKLKVNGFEIKNQQQMFEILSDLLAVCPIRHNVERYIHLAMQGETIADNYLAFDELLKSVPVLKSDVTRFLIHNYFVSNKEVKIPLTTLSLIEESELAKNFVMCYGKEKAISLLQSYKSDTSRFSKDLNVDKILSYVESSSNEKIVINNKEYDNCCDVLEDAVNQIIKERNFDESARKTLMVDANLQLSYLITHFGKVNFKNPEFLNALTNFYECPIEEVFKNEEEINDTPYFYGELVAKNMGRYLKAYREQPHKIVKNLSDVEFDLADEDGISFAQKEKEFLAVLKELNIEYEQAVADCGTSIKLGFRINESCETQEIVTINEMNK